MSNVLSFGEILWDVFDGKKQLGGAPLNFAAHFVKLGGDADMISAVGDDTLGDEAIDEVKSHGVGVEYVARVQFPTGRCNVTLVGGSPSYDLVCPVAYDTIPLCDTSRKYDALYYGTLACRSKDSLQTLDCLLKRKDIKEHFFDVNIRQNYYTPELLDHLAGYATILKVSREEIGVFGNGEPLAVANMLLDKYANLNAIALTLDKDGAVFIRRGHKPVYSQKPTGKVVSTVGGGDSFSACLLHDLMSGKCDADAVKRAVTLSDYVVTQLGAIPEYSDELFAALFN